LLFKGNNPFLDKTFSFKFLDFYGCTRFAWAAPGLPDFSKYNIPRREKMYQTTSKYFFKATYLPEYHKTYQQCPFQGPPKYTLIWIFVAEI
jgi:hypothetical protein